MAVLLRAHGVLRRPDSFSGEHAVAGALTILDWTCLVIVVGCIQTIIVRLRRILEALQAETTGVAR